MRLIDLEPDDLAEMLKEVALDSFYHQAITTIVAERVEDVDELMDLVIEIGPKLVFDRLERLEDD